MPTDPETVRADPRRPGPRADIPTPEVVDVTVDTAEPTLLLLMWDADGGAWLVPGYAMKVSEGWWSSVVSLVDGVIALPEPIAVEPMVTDPELVG